MKRVTAEANARAALAGNPSDGYFGRTISLALANFSARVVVYEWPELEIIPPPSDGTRFPSLEALAHHVERNGYYGAIRLVKASIKRFHDYCVQNRIALPDQNFSIRYETDVPRGVGLAGSSAIITATFRGLMRFYGVQIPLPELPNWVLSVEKGELRIEGGLQDRVAQAYGGATFMDFDREKLERDGFGEYESLDPTNLPPFYLAYQTEFAEPSDVVHSDLRARYERGDAEVLAAMEELKAITSSVRRAIEARDEVQIGHGMNANYDVRARILTIAKGHRQMIEIAREVGASANFAGSGGAIIGTFGSDEKRLLALKENLGRIGCRVLVPRIAPSWN